jgi:hypothetical protein
MSYIIKYLSRFLDSFRDIDIEVYRMCSKVKEEKNRKSSRKLVFKKESFGETMLLECLQNQKKFI